MRPGRNWPTCCSPLGFGVLFPPQFVGSQTLTSEPLEGLLAPSLLGPPGGPGVDAQEHVSPLCPWGGWSPLSLAALRQHWLITLHDIGVHSSACSPPKRASLGFHVLDPHPLPSGHQAGVCIWEPVFLVHVSHFVLWSACEGGRTALTLSCPTDVSQLSVRGWMNGQRCDMYPQCDAARPPRR